MNSSQASPAGDVLLGTTLAGRYRILTILGEGGMGRVYLAEQKMGQSSRKVAVKTLLPEKVADSHVVERFHRESGTVIQLKHPNTIQFFDFGELEDGTLFIVMEYIEGASLASVLLEHGPMSFERVKRIVLQIAGSLHEAHLLGIVHRDLKPDNILLTERAGHRDFVKVLDFGIAKRSEAEDKKQATLTRQGMILGTPPYMSPEQFSGKALDARSDVYSLSLMVYEMLTGRSPFEANTAWEWASQHLSGAPLSIESHPATVSLPQQAKRVLMRSMSKDPNERPASVLEFVQEFSGIDLEGMGWQSASFTSAKTEALPAPGPVAGHAKNPESGVMRKSSLDEAEVLAQKALGTQKSRTMVWTVLFLTLSGAFAFGIFQFLRHERDKRNALIAHTRRHAHDTLKSSLATQRQIMEEPKERPQAAQKASTPDEAAEDENQSAGETRAIVQDEQTQAGSASRIRKPEMLSGEAKQLFDSIGQAIERDNFEQAAHLFTQAKKSFSRHRAIIEGLRLRLAKRGANRIGGFILQGLCPQAQSLYRVLAAVGAAQNARQHFADHPDEGCALP